MRQVHREMDNSCCIASTYDIQIIRNHCEILLLAARVATGRMDGCCYERQLRILMRERERPCPHAQHRLREIGCSLHSEGSRSPILSLGDERGQSIVRRTGFSASG